eukprot:jgi/Bigna1/61791/fgenesh1_kg.26_\
MSGHTEQDKLTELKNEVNKLKSERDLLKGVKMTPQQAAGEILEHLKKAEVDPIMATDNPWRPSTDCCVLA